MSQKGLWQAAPVTRQLIKFIRESENTKQGGSGNKAPLTGLVVVPAESKMADRGELDYHVRLDTSFNNDICLIQVY